MASVIPGDSCLVHQVVYLAAYAWENLACVRLFIRGTVTSVCLGCCSISIVVDAIVVAIQELVVVS